MWLKLITRMAIGCVALHFCSALTYAQQINVTNTLKVPDKSGKCVETKILGQPMYVKRGWQHAQDCGEKKWGNKDQL